MYSKYNAYKLVNDFEIVCLLDGDDWLSENNVLETLVNAYSDPDVSVVTSNYNVYKNGKIIDNTYIPNYDENTILTKSGLPVKGKDFLDNLQIEHILPQTPKENVQEPRLRAEPTQGDLA